MLADGLLQEVLAGQSAYGAFRSRAFTPDVIDDENCFITALVLLELAPLQYRLPKEAHRHLTAALDFLESCAEPTLPDAFRFYPCDPRSPRVRYEIDFGPDIDDTVLALAALASFGRRTWEAVGDALRRLLEPWAIGQPRPDDPSWVRPGAFRTWFNREFTDNPVDLCVNANLAALYARCGHTASPHYQAIYAMFREALPQLLRNRPDMSQCANYYAHPIEILHAVSRVCDAGGVLFLEVLGQLRECPWATADRGWPRDRPICGDATGPPYWVAPCLQAARQLRWELNAPR